MRTYLFVIFNETVTRSTKKNVRLYFTFFYKNAQKTYFYLLNYILLFLSILSILNKMIMYYNLHDLDN